MLRVFEMFAGYGGASFSLQGANIPFVSVGYSEINKQAIQCYNQNHQSNKEFSKEIPNYGDCSKINPEELPDFDLLTGGFPCQSFSTAGHGLGEEDIRGTLYQDIIRIAEKKKPKYMLLENVRGLVTKRHEKTFNKILSELDRIGYFVKWELLNSRNYGTPQKRERVYLVCYRKDLYRRFDLFNFPKTSELTYKASELLEHGAIDRDASLCITASYFKGSTLPGYLEKTQRQLIFGNSIVVPNATKLGYKFADIGDFVLLANPKSKTNRGRVQKGILQTLTTSGHIATVEKDNKKGIYFRILTGIECFRFMGFFKDQINLTNISESQRKKLAGNGWDINLVGKIFKEMFKYEI